MSNANNPAFPVFDPKAPASDCLWTNGLTKRELLAGMAMQGLLSNLVSNLAAIRSLGFKDHEIEQFAVIQADALLKAMEASDGRS